MKEISNYRGKKVLVLGLAKSGNSAAKLLHKLGAQLTVNDGNQVQALDLVSLGIKVVTGSHPLSLLDGIDLVVKNPGISYDNPMVRAAETRHIPIITEVELAYQVSESPIIGITGTNGKTTTSTLIARLLNEDGKPARLAGNIGIAASEVAESTSRFDTLVMELSSFQLLGIDSFRPRIAVITNIFSAHLDYHGSQEAYEAAKWLIQKNMGREDILVLNFNQEKMEVLSHQSRARILPFAIERQVDGAYSLDGKIYFRGEYVMDVIQLSLPGNHNLENALAAIAVSKALGVKNATILRVLSRFSGVKHRLQYLGDIQGRKVYNDSKATNTFSTQKALSGFDKSKVWLLCGGLDRGDDFSDLKTDLKRIRGMVVMGETAPKLRQLGEDLGLPVLDADDVAQALTLAYDRSSPGDIILLSPASAAWDQYKNFEERGDLFIAAFDHLEKKGLR